MKFESTSGERGKENGREGKKTAFFALKFIQYGISSV